MSQSADALAAQRRELVELQQRENERLLETTTPIFNARKETKPICPDIEAQLISCYRLKKFEKGRRIFQKKKKLIKVFIKIS